MSDKVQISETASILIVDDRAENLLALEGWLEKPDLKIVRAASGNEALGLMLEEDFALVLLDVQMPGMDGFEAAELMRLSEKTKNVPIIFVTAINNEQKHVFKGYSAGAVDYLSKPLDPDILKAKVDVFLQLYRQKRSLEDAAEELKRAAAAMVEVNEQLLREITGHKRAEEALEEERRRLQQALDEITTLRGIVPICSYCKKIRDDKGYWSQVDQYISKHTEAKFSHGICPACFEREMKEIKGET